MLSRKAKYALQAMLFLADNYGQGPLLISEMARREAIPQKFLEMILLELKNSGLLQSKKGKGGGYTLARPPDSVSVGQILRVVEGPLAPLPCVSRTAYKRCEECRDERSCGIRIVMKEVHEASTRILDNTNLKDVLRRSALESLGKGALTYAI